MQNHSTPLSQTALFCDEFDENEFAYSTEYCNAAVISSKSVNNSEFDDEYIKILLQREINCCSSFAQKHDHQNIISSAAADIGNSSRNHAINYILHMASVFGFQLQTVYLSLCYFDSFMRTIYVDKTWAIRLLSMACLSLAAKLEENRVPSLSEFQIGNHKFDLKYIQKMELLVLDTLEWKMGYVTTFAYLPCFFNKFFDEPPSEVASSMIINLILAFMKETDLMDHHQYAIASASILTTLDPSLSREAIQLKIDSIPFSKFLDTEDIISCYKIMVQLEMDKTKKLDLPVSQDDQSTIYVFHDTEVSSSLSIKRKALTFKDFDEENNNVDLHKKSRCCI